MSVQSTTWSPPGLNRYRLPESTPSRQPSELHAVPTPREGAANTAKPWHPANPLFWFAAIAGVTFGFMGYSTSVRVGNSKASLNLGSTS